MMLIKNLFQSYRRHILYYIAVVFILDLININVVYAFVAVQDLLIISEMKIKDKLNREIDLLNKIIHGKGFTTDRKSLDLPGGIKFFPKKDLKCNAIDYWSKIIKSIDVEAGVVLGNNFRYLGILISPDVGLEKRAFRYSDFIEIDLSEIIPMNIEIGAIGKISYDIIQLLPYENEYQGYDSSINIAIKRIKKGSIYVLGNKDATINQVVKLPFIIAKGSKKARWWGKGVLATGLNIIIEGENIVKRKARDNNKNIINVVLGITGGYLVGRGLQMKTNIEADESDEALMLPSELTPGIESAVASNEKIISKKDSRINIKDLNDIYLIYTTEIFKIMKEKPLRVLNPPPRPGNLHTIIDDN